MSQEKDIKRNRPSDEGRANDPDLRDESAIQPGSSTISQSRTDDTNQRVTRSAMDDSELTEFDVDDDADATFDDMDKDDKV